MLITTKVAVCKKDSKDFEGNPQSCEHHPVYGDATTYVELADEAGGMFLQIKQHPSVFNGEQEQCINLDFDEIDDLYNAMLYIKSSANMYEKG